MSAQDTAVVLTGGCLCAAIRFEVSFHKDGQWPPVVHLPPTAGSYMNLYR